MTNRQRMATHVAYREQVLKARKFRRNSRKFIREYELTDDDFKTVHWQTLFAITYPDARS